MNYGKKDKKVIYDRFCFEMTRRCNLKCLWCCKGDAQNLDMSQQVIDRTLDEIETAKVDQIVLFGGEPFLNKNGVIYLIDQIIKRNIKILTFNVFTNGTIKDEDIKTALVKMGVYIQKYIDTKDGALKKWAFDKKHEKAYKDDDESRCIIIVSTDLHNNKNVVDDFIDYYNSGVPKNILNAFNQGMSRVNKKGDVVIYDKNITIDLSGNALKNIDTLREMGYNNLHLYTNKYNFINEDDSNIFVEKMITVSANGNVYAGITAAFDIIDKVNICNIFECDAGDIITHINNWCWQYPESKEQSKKLVRSLTYIHRYENDLGIEDITPQGMMPEELYNAHKAYINQWNEFMKAVLQFHRYYPYLTQSEIIELTGLYAAKDETGENQKQILSEFCDYGDDFIPTDEEIQTYITILEAENASREAEADPQAAARHYYKQLFKNITANDIYDAIKTLAIQHGRESRKRM